MSFEYCRWQYSSFDTQKQLIIKRNLLDTVTIGFTNTDVWKFNVRVLFLISQFLKHDAELVYNHKIKEAPVAMCKVYTSHPCVAMQEHSKIKRQPHKKIYSPQGIAFGCQLVFQTEAKKIQSQALVLLNTSYKSRSDEKISTYTAAAYTLFTIQAVYPTVISVERIIPVLQLQSRGSYGTL